MKARFILFLLFFFLFSCKKQRHFVQYQGDTMGTSYSVTCLTYNKEVSFLNSMESLLDTLNKSLSTYDSNSIISKINQAKDDDIQIDSFFLDVFKMAKTIHQETKGSFDPTVMPLVNAWGFGYEKSSSVDSTLIDSLVYLVDFDAFTLVQKAEKWFIQKSKPNAQLDFSAIAKGYGVDVIGEFLEQQNIAHYLVDIGGEIRAKGRNLRQEKWSVGIDLPIDTLQKRTLAKVVFLDNEAIATSGNYRNFYLKDGKKYAHTINPKTGYSELNNLLSASIITSNCAAADAYATACMVMGLDKAKAWASKQPEVKVLFIYSNESGKLETYASENLLLHE